jgi:DNA helicase-2/ATP-dependent DNA helicase PcrA
LEDLTPSQHQAVTTTSATVCVLASAGAGKTRVLARRAAFQVVTGAALAEHVLAITFTRKAAGELRERLFGLGLAQSVTTGTFHSVAMSQLRRWWADRRTPEPTLLQRKGRLLDELAAGRPGLADAGTGELASHIEWAKARLVEPAAFAAAAHEAHRELQVDADAVATLYARYEDEKRRRRLVDFDDLLARYANALETDSRFAAAQRWKWRHVFVDELQDVNPLQCRLLLALVAGNDDLFVVGDPNQAIYGWNGADPGFLTDFPRRWPDAEVVHLDDNHRSSPQVVAAAAAVLGPQARAGVRSSRPDGPLPRLSSFLSDDAEAAAVASQMLEAHRRGLSWDQMAVLARTNSQLTTIAQVLASAGVPFTAVVPHESADDPPAPQPPAPQPPAPQPPAPQPPAPRSPNPGAPDPAQPGQDIGGESVTVCSFHRSKGLQWSAVWVCGLEAGFVPIAYASGPAGTAEERRLLYVALTRAERELYCSWARQRRSANGVPLRREPSPWLTILAAHCSREGEVPTKEAGGTVPGAVATAFLTSARRRLAGPGTVAGRTGGQPVDPLSTAVAEHLKQWRQRLARASGVPPHVLLHDSTVQVIASRRPASAEELLAVPGMGPVKVARFGPAILDVVRQSTLEASA